MSVTEEWLDSTGTKLSVEDIRQMQLLYEQPEGTLGPVVGTRSLYLSDKGSLYQCVEYYDGQKTNERYPAGIELALKYHYRIFNPSLMSSKCRQQSRNTA